LSVVATISGRLGNSVPSVSLVQREAATGA
jgi:hypothetical protein